MGRSSMYGEGKGEIKGIWGETINNKGYLKNHMETYNHRGFLKYIHI